MCANRIVHLHTHSELSVRDGLSRIDDLCAAAAADGQPAIAITDHGGLSGTWQLASAAKRHGIKPIFGCELYLSADTFTTSSAQKKAKKPAGEGDYSNRTHHHITVLAENAAGWRNLLILTADAHENFHGRRLAQRPSPRPMRPSG